MIQVIGMISSDQVIDSFISIWAVVTDDELLSIIILGGDFSVTKIYADLFSPLKYYCRIFQEVHAWFFLCHFSY